MADNISPEERLFKVIQEDKKSPSEGENFEKKKKAKISLRGVKWFFTNLKPRAVVRQGLPGATSIALPGKFREIDLKAINKILTVILIFLTVLVIHFAINKRPSITKIIDAVSKIKIQTIEKKAIETFKPASFYQEEIKKRDIFQPLPKVREKVILPRKKQALKKLKEMAKDLKLQGISWGESPKAMIKNEKEDKMYFLREGQMIGTTGIELKTILKNKAVISYAGEELELL